MPANRPSRALPPGTQARNERQRSNDNALRALTRPHTPLLYTPAHCLPRDRAPVVEESARWAIVRQRSKPDNVSPPSRGERGAEGPPMSVRTQPGSTAFTSTPFPDRCARESGSRRSARLRHRVGRRIRGHRRKLTRAGRQFTTRPKRAPPSAAQTHGRFRSRRKRWSRRCCGNASAGIESTSAFSNSRIAALFTSTSTDP